MAFPESGILDDFNRSDEGPPPSSSWADAVSGLEVVSNACKASASGSPSKMSYWSDETFDQGQECYVQITTKGPTGSEVGVVINYDEVGGTGYQFYVDVNAGTDNLVLAPLDGAGDVLITPQEASDGDWIGISRSGNTVTGYYRAGAGAWTTIGAVSNDTYIDAKYVALFADHTDWVLDNFGGGDNPVAITSVTISGDTVAETGTAITLTATIDPTGATPPVTYTWSPAPGSGQGTASAVYTFDETELGANTITVTAANSVNSVQDTHVVTVYDLLARAYICSAVNGVTNVGNVYCFKRFELLRPDANDLMKYTVGSDEVIRFWEIQFHFGNAVEDRMEFRDGDKAGIRRTWVFVIHGYFGWNDEDVSEQIAISIAKDVMNALDDSEDLHDGSKFFNADPVQLTAFEPWSQWNEAVHRVTLRQTVMEYLT